MGRYKVVLTVLIAEAHCSCIPHFTVNEYIILHDFEVGLYRRELQEFGKTIYICLGLRQSRAAVRYAAGIARKCD